MVGRRSARRAAPTAISEAATLAAIGFLEGYAMPMAKRAFGDAAWPQAERDAAALGKWLLAQRPLPALVNARALRQRLRCTPASAERYDAALAELEAAGWVRPQPIARRRQGRAAEQGLGGQPRAGAPAMSDRLARFLKARPG